MKVAVVVCFFVALVAGVVWSEGSARTRDIAFRVFVGFGCLAVGLAAGLWVR